MTEKPKKKTSVFVDDDLEQAIFQKAASLRIYGWQAAAARALEDWAANEPCENCGHRVGDPLPPGGAIPLLCFNDLEKQALEDVRRLRERLPDDFAEALGRLLARLPAETPHKSAPIVAEKRKRA